MLLHTGLQAPWWLVALTGCEAYASFRRVLLRYSYKNNKKQQQQQPQRPRPPTRLRHFTSLRLVAGAPVDVPAADATAAPTVLRRCRSRSR